MGGEESSAFISLFLSSDGKMLKSKRSSQTLLISVSRERARRTTPHEAEWEKGEKTQNARGRRASTTSKRRFSGVTPWLIPYEHEGSL